MRKRMLLFCSLLLVVTSGQNCDALDALLARLSVTTTNSLDWTVSSPFLLVPQGSSTNLTITVVKKFNIDAQVELQTQGVPPNWTVTFDPPVIPETGTESTLTLTVPSDTQTGEYFFDLIAQEAGQAASPPFVITVTVHQPGVAQDFSLSVSPQEYSFGHDQDTLVFTYVCTNLMGFEGIVTITLSGLTDDVVLVQPPSPPSFTLAANIHEGRGIFTLRNSAIPRAEPLDLEVTVTAASGETVHSRTLTLHIPECPPPADFAGDWFGLYSCTSSCSPEGLEGAITLTITQNGATASFTDSLGGSFSGTVCGDELTFSSDDPAVVETGTLTLNIGGGIATKHSHYRAAADPFCEGACEDNLVHASP